MVEFYEVIVRIPDEVKQHLPSIPDGFVDWTATSEWNLPEDSDLVLSEIEQPQLTIANKVQLEILEEWKKITKINPKFFVQFEKGTDFFHLHILIETTKMKSTVLGRYLKQIKSKVVSLVYENVEPTIPHWMAATKTSQVGGANKVRSQTYIPAYLLRKSQPELQWAWTNMEEYKKAALNLSERKKLVEEHQAMFRWNLSQGSTSGISGPVIRTKSSQRYMNLVKWLVEKGITSEKQWIEEDQESFLSFNATSNTRSQIRAALDNAMQVMNLTKTAKDYLVGSSAPPEDMTTNRIYQIFKMNGYDPLYAGSILVGWCGRQFGKRNTIWLFGPATTGKTNMAEAIAHAVPAYGCVNWTNENFPFNDCLDKMIIWWEEGKMTAKVVESAKAILGGSKVRVDQKGKSSAEMDQTPAIVTSNTDMCIVVDGNSITLEHQQPLQDRMFKFELTRVLQRDFGKITKQEVRDFFRWASDHRREVTEEFLVRKVHSRKRPTPSDGGEDTRPVEKARPVGGDSSFFESDMPPGPLWSQGATWPET